MKVFGIVLAFLSATALAMPAAEGDLQVDLPHYVLNELGADSSRTFNVAAKVTARPAASQAIAVATCVAIKLAALPILVVSARTKGVSVFMI